MSHRPAQKPLATGTVRAFMVKVDFWGAVVDSEGRWCCCTMSKVGTVITR